jgi:hypothetical protein
LKEAVVTSPEDGPGEASGTVDILSRVAEIEILGSGSPFV